MKLKNLFIAGLIALSGAFALATTATTDRAIAFDSSNCPAGSLGKENKGKSDIKSLADCNLPKESEDYDLMTKARTIINVIVGAMGIIAVIVIVLGGIFYITSAGDAAKAKRGQNAIIYGIVGLIIALLAFAIVNFVLKSVFS